MPGAARSGRIAVIDIGSNSIRLVVYDRLYRSPIPIFNEKVLCGLGRGLGASGNLNEGGIGLALQNLVRFVRLTAAMGVERLDMLATAAVREAANGPEFVAEVEQRCAHPVTVLSGDDEARLSALGVLSAFPRAEGLMGDLGGGSLEVVELSAGHVGRAATLPLGPLRFIGSDGEDRTATGRVIDDEIARLGWLSKRAAQTFFPVGGAWRALARIHMEQVGYPVHVIHGYSLPFAEAEKLARVVAGLGPRSLVRIPGMPRRRLDTLPVAALLLERLIRQVRPKSVTFSAFGLREGRLFEQLSPQEQAEDPLLAGATEVAAHDSRFGDIASALVAWTDPLFAGEEPAKSRLRVAACHLSDIAWRDHPDYRATHTLARILRLPLAGTTHRDRAFLGYTAFIRYGGGADNDDSRFARAVLRPKSAGRAEALGRALRLAYTLSGGTKEILSRSALKLEDGALTLMLPSDGSVPVGEVVERRCGALADALAARGFRIET